MLPFLVLGVLLLSTPQGTHAQQLFRCGATYQDRPCENSEVQQRFSPVAGTLPVQQINPESSKACARVAEELFGYWKRLKAGEDFEQLRTEVSVLPQWREQKDHLRNHLLTLRDAGGHPSRVRSDLESACMAQQRAGSAPLRTAPDWRDATRRADFAAARARAAAERAYMSARP